MDGTSYQLLAGSCFTQDQNRGIGRRHFGNLAKNFTQLLGRTNNVFEHRVPIDLLSQRQVFVACSLFGASAVINVCSRRVPTNHLALLVSIGIVLNEKPAVPAVFPTCALFHLKWISKLESSRSLVAQSFQIIWMKDSFAKVRR